MKYLAQQVKPLGLNKSSVRIQGNLGKREL